MLINHSDRKQQIRPMSETSCKPWNFQSGQGRVHRRLKEVIPWELGLVMPLDRWMRVSYLDWTE